MLSTNRFQNLLCIFINVVLDVGSTVCIFPHPYYGFILRIIIIIIIVMAANLGKFQVMFLWMREQPKLTLEINDITIPLTDRVKLLGVTIDSQLKFDDHINALCQTGNRKVSAFSRVANFLNYDKGKILYNTCVISSFNYCPLIWMYHGKPQVIG